jgi:hypothetical protein
MVAIETTSARMRERRHSSASERDRTLCARCLDLITLDELYDRTRFIAEAEAEPPSDF